MVLSRLILCALLVGVFARDDSPRSIHETVNKNVVIVRSTANDHHDTLRLQMVRTGDSKLFLKYRYQDGDDESDSSYRFQYSLRLDHLIEYHENGDSNSGFQPDDDELIQTVSFKGTDFSDWKAETDSNGARAYSTSNGVFGLTARVGERSFDGDDDPSTTTTVMPDEVKFDIQIDHFPWLSDESSHVAVIAAVQSSMEIDRDGNRVSLDGSDAYITWDDSCVVDDDHDAHNCAIVLSAIYDDDSREDDEGSADDHVKELVFSFVDEGSHPAKLVWDPIMGSDPSAASNVGVAVPVALVLSACGALLAVLL
jgi:hypothetical protein